LGPHSWDPGITPSLVFWTTPVTRGSVKVDLDEERASLQAKNIRVFDSFTLIPNAIDPNHPAGHVNSIINSLRMEWRNTTRATTFDNCDPNAFRGNYFEDSATIQVIATTPPRPAATCPATPARHGFRFVSNPANTSVSRFAQIGREHNGVFY
jgi:hypothetical protein